MNFLCLCSVMFAINTWGLAYFNLDRLPAWINGTTIESTCPGAAGVIATTLSTIAANITSTSDT